MGRQQSRNYGNLKSIVLLQLTDKFETSSGALTSRAVAPKWREKKDKCASHPPEAIVPEPSGTWTGDKDLAIDQIVAVERVPNYLSYGQLKLHPYWDSLRGDPRFEKIVASLAPK